MYNRKFTLFTCAILFLVISLPVFSQSDMPPEKNRMRPDHAPTPFGAEEISRGCPVGREITYLMQQPGKPDIYQTTRFKENTLNGTVYEAVMKNKNGKQQGEKREAEAVWKELQSHASFPRSRTEIFTESCTVPAGTFDCWLYVVTKEENGVVSRERYWFGKTLPGPPVKFTVFQNGKLAFNMILIKNQFSKK